MSVRLKVEHGQDAGKTWALKQPGVYVIGRDPTSALRVLDMKVSKGHCEIEVSGPDGVWLRDLKSTVDRIDGAEDLLAEILKDAEKIKGLSGDKPAG